MAAKKTTKPAASSPKSTAKSAEKSAEKAAAEATTGKAEAPKAAAQPAVNVHHHGASAAASILANRGKAASAPQAASQGESAAFKKLKASLGGQKFSAGSPLAGGPKSAVSHKPSASPRQTGYVSTKNSSAPTGVPRRTSGG
ncbi:MAG TPA: hypothetical protein VF624_12205 [Tepidisphaeraceae bacterium]|jgi:hypothetical protein